MNNVLEYIYFAKLNVLEKEYEENKNSKNLYLINVGLNK